MTILRRLLALLPLVLLTLLAVQMPLDPPKRLEPLLRLDALAAVMLIVLLLGLAILWAGLPGRLLRSLALAAGIALTYLTTSLPLLVLGLLIAVLSFELRFSGFRLRRENTKHTVWPWVPVLLLAAGVGWLRLRAGTWNLEAQQTAAALDSLSFGLVLLASVFGLALLPVGYGVRFDSLWSLTLRPAWLYPLARLYELGQWNLGWVLATALLGGAVALWAGWTAPWIDDYEARAERVQAAVLGGALASLGLTSEAGLAGALVGVFVALLVAAGFAIRRRHPLLWLVSGPVPLALPFIALWLQIGAAVASGLVALAAAIWLSAIGWGIAALRSLSEDAPEPSSWMLRLLAGLSLLAGVGSPLLLRVLIVPVLLQLGAGITPFGGPTIQPWVGLEVRNVQSAPVTSWLSVVIVGLLLLLAAITYVLLRLLEQRRQLAGTTVQEDIPHPRESWAKLSRFVRRNVPWLPWKDAGRDD